MEEKPKNIIDYLDQMAARRNASTSGPWVYSNHWDHCKAVVEVEKRIICDVYEHEDVYSRNFNHHEKNARFIAAARTEHEILEKALRIAYLKLNKIHSDDAQNWIGNSSRQEAMIALKEIETLFEEKK